MKQIQLNKSGKKYRGMFVVIVDDNDFELLNRKNWSVAKHGHSLCAVSVYNKKLIKMHRLIMNAEKGQMIDHIDGNGLNNQRSNLRFCTNSENQKNKKAVGTSKYLGVHLHNQIKQYFRKKTNDYSIYISTSWVAKIKNNNKYIHLGSFKTEEEAALAYNEAALKYHGEFARLNIIK